jgi:hypothetical protein
MEEEMEKARGSLSDVISVEHSVCRASDLGGNWLLARNPHLTELMSLR